MNEANLIYVIADYGNLHDLAFAEVLQRLHAETSVTTPIHPFSVPAFDTIATGFTLAQTALNSPFPMQHKFFVNTAPRKDDLTPRTRNAGEGLVYAKLTNGVEIIAVNSGFSLSFVRDHAVTIRDIACDRAGSQFRSRDIFPIAFGNILRGDMSALGADIRNSVPDTPNGVVCYTDGYGNMKCSIPPEDLNAIKGKLVTLHVNGVMQVARVADGIFAVADGEFCLSVGSSGWAQPDGTRQQFCEIVKRGGSAADAFARPAGGTSITWRVAS
jgi:hypothetical protein